jgi:asparagine synthase (glutamine-hydrolysing)
MFAFAIWDSRKQELFVARDRFGKKPLYYTLLGGRGFLFGSELKALKQLASSVGAVWDPSDESIYHYLSLGVIPQPMTVYSEAHALEPGHWMLFKDGILTRNCYWRLSYQVRTDIGYDEALERVRTLIRESVGLRLRSDVPLGVFLSGGVDSSIVALEASKVLGDSLNTLTVSIPNANFDESPVAERTARFLGVKNIICNVSFDLENDIQKVVAIYDQPYSDSSALLTLRVSELARTHMKVVLTGDGGDELFAGYRRHVAAHYVARLQSYFSSDVKMLSRLARMFSVSRRSRLGLILRLLRCLTLHGSEQYLCLTTDMLRDEDKKNIWMRGPQLSTETYLAGMISSELSGLREQMDTDIRINLLSDLLVKMDMATMAASIEARSPLLDHKLAEFLVSLPPSYLVHSFHSKALLRDAYSGALPDEVIKGPKRGFELPLDSILKTELRPLLMDTLGATNSRVSSYLSRGFINELLASRTMNDRNWGYIVYSLLVLELWLQRSTQASS